MAKSHVVHLGRLVGNLQSLETQLRFCLLKADVNSNASMQSTWPYVVGENRDVDQFTNYDTLGVLISNYNSRIQPKQSSLVVDLEVVKIRDLLAHGRVTSSSMDEENLTIVKFSKPAGGKVRVAAAALMDEVWFEAGNKLIRDQIDKVERAIPFF